MLKRFEFGASNCGVQRLILTLGSQMVATDSKARKFRIQPPLVDLNHIAPSEAELQALFEEKYRMSYGLGWGPKLRHRFGYYMPEDFYEALVAKLVVENCSWVDVGCGRDIFPSNKKLAETLSKKASFVYGIDPDDNVQENPFLTERFQGLVEDCQTQSVFDVITMRMVAEHIQTPQLAVGKLAELTAKGGIVIVFTPNKWSPMSLVAKAVPFKLHNPLKRLIWDSEARDTFPVAYKLNTRRELAKHFCENGFRELFFAYLDDCTVTGGYPIANRVELVVRNMFCKVGVPYWENCLLAVFQRK